MNPNKVQDPLKQQVRKKTLISFGAFFLLMGLAYWSWLRLYHSATTSDDPAIHAPLRKVLDLNGQLFQGSFSEQKLAKTFPVRDAVKQVRVNGNLGLGGTFDTSTWKLHLVRAPGDTLLIGMDEIRRLPKTEIVFDFKCIEGWDQVTYWAGVKMMDFLKAYHLDSLTAHKYIGLATPDNGYYVGIDMPSAIHPQTLLCYEMNGRPLPMNQGAPLRLIIPVKYGIKHLKRIGSFYFSDTPPRDYWAEQGYDYYSGH